MLPIMELANVVMDFERATHRMHMKTDPGLDSWNSLPLRTFRVVLTLTITIPYRERA